MTDTNRLERTLMCLQQGSQTRISTRAKKCLRGPQKWVKSALISHKTPISTIFFEIFDDDTGHTITSCGLRVRDPCSTVRSKNATGLNTNGRKDKPTA